MSSLPPRVRRGAGAFVASALATLAAATPAAADTISAGDAASLAAAVQRADAQTGPSTIELGAGTYAPDTTLTIRGDVTIVGPSVRGLTISGAGEAPGTDLFAVAVGAHATFVNVSLSSSGYQNQGAAIEDLGSVELDNSTLAGNDGPSLLVQPDATATVRDSTLSWGLEEGLVDHGSVTLVNSTVADNAVEGIDDRPGDLVLVNTIVAGNGARDCSAPASSSDDSLDGDGSCGVGALGHVNPQLGELIWNGGPTLTQALAAGSPAVDAGDAGQCPTVDQRYAARPAGRCDIGAYQTGAASPTGAPNGSSPGQGAAGAGSSGAPPTPGGGRPPGGPTAPGISRRRVTGAAGRGTLRGPRRRPITFALEARVAAPHGSLAYRDLTAGVWLRRASISAVRVDVAHGVVAFSGSAFNAAGHRRVRFVAAVTEQGRVRTLRVRLSSGYDGGGRLVRGALAATMSG